MIDDERKACHLVEQFIVAHEEWETAANDSWKNRKEKGKGTTLSGGDQAVIDEINANFVRLIEPFVRRIGPQNASGWGVPFQHESKNEKVIDCQSINNGFIVTTKLERPVSSTANLKKYLYKILETNAGLKISNVSKQEQE